MKPASCLLALLATLPLAAQADVYKCVVHYNVTYQDQPCQNADEQELVISSVRTDRIDRDRPAPVAPIIDVLPDPTPGLLAPDANGLMLGMFDTQVLNLRGWGRPAKITRSKAKGAWREQWTYSGERQLQFANGRLAAIGGETSF